MSDTPLTDLQLTLSCAVDQACALPLGSVDGRYKALVGLYLVQVGGAVTAAGIECEAGEIANDAARERDALRVGLDEARVERDHEARCRIRRREERDAARGDVATLLEAIEAIDAVSDPGAWVDAIDAALSTASKIRERSGA